MLRLTGPLLESFMTTVHADEPRQGAGPRSPVLRPRRLLGRDREIVEITESILSNPVTTLVGPGGVGKTALATTVAAGVNREAFADGVAIVWLAHLRSAEPLSSTHTH